ncbi:hypothetical protein [Erwinia sp. Leaf53]|uniref:hypothetical protein n=1 Tax=Erwinia sp. Leaf53 TaxID=1736225 RepID=UPI0006F273DA|nr:hypothetical protein [Erwinia sp. Leaf53]KQN56726.1 hypothetical protein ASF13_06290 [Erwinia sp. Leaf53]
MNEQLVNALIAALTAETAAKKQQTAAITRLAESNESLSAIIIQSFATDELEEDSLGIKTYLSGKPMG